MRKLIFIFFLTLLSISNLKKMEKTPLEVIICVTKNKDIIQISKELYLKIISKNYLDSISYLIQNLEKIKNIINSCSEPSEINLQNYNNKEKINMSNKEFIEIMNTGNPVKAGSKLHLKMIELSNEAMKITSEMNNKYNEPLILRKLMSKLIDQELDEGFGIFPPFNTDCGKNIHLGKRVFINSGCKFQDQGGIYIGDDSLIGHNTVIATLNHNIDPNNRGDIIPKPVKLGKKVWIGAGVIILPGVSIGDNSIIGAGSVVTKDIPSDMIAVGNPAKVVKSIYDK